MTRKKKSYNAGQYVRTVILTDGLKEAVIQQPTTLKKGQWVMDGHTGNRGQFVDVHRKPRYFSLGRRSAQFDGQLHIREAKAGMKFKDYQEPYAP